MNRKTASLFVFVVLALLLAAVVAPAHAADLSNLSGQSCGDGCGTFHFVNNQTGGAGPGVLTATFSDSITCVTGPSSVLSNVQHFFCGGCGDLTGASTTLPGKLVLSDFSCEKKSPPPPK